MISKSFIKSSLLYTIAGSLPMASSLILLPFYTHYLSTESFGAFFILLAFSLLIQIVVTFSFDTSIYVHFHEYKSEPKKLATFISSSFIYMAIAGIAVSLVMGLVGDVVLRLIMKKGSIVFYPYGLMAAFTGVLLSFFKVYNSLLQTQQKPKLFFRSNLLAFSLIAVFTIVGLRLEGNSLFGPIGARLLSGVICGTWCFYRIVKEFGFRFDYGLIRSTFNFNFYSFIYQLQQWLMNSFDRILLLLFLPLPEVGVYAFLTSCLVIMEFVLNGLYNSISPKVVGIIYDQKLKGSTKELNRYYNGLTVVAMVLVSATILVFPVLIEKLIWKPDYQKVIPYIPYAVLVYLLRPLRLYLGIPFGILKYTRPLPIIYSVVTAIKILLLILLASRMGIYGVIMASLVSYTIELLILYLAGRNRFAFKFNVFKMLIAPVSLILLVIAIEPFFGAKYPLMIHALYFVICTMVLGFIYKNEVGLFNPLKSLTDR